MADLHGDNVAAGFNLGAMYQFDDNTGSGSTIAPASLTRSTARNPCSSRRCSPPPSPAAAAQLRFRNSSASTQITLPDNVTLGFYRQIDPRWAVMADVQWTHWSLLRNVVVVPSNGTPTTVLPENWRNTWFASVGASYRVTEKLLLQAGFAYDESPVTDRNRTTRIPDSDRYDLGAGATYSVLPNVNLPGGLCSCVLLRRQHRQCGVGQLWRDRPASTASRPILSAWVRRSSSREARMAGGEPAGAVIETRSSARDVRHGGGTLLLAAPRSISSVGAGPTARLADLVDRAARGLQGLGVGKGAWSGSVCRTRPISSSSTSRC